MAKPRRVRTDEPIDCSYTDEIVCPHCGYEHRDSWERNDGDEGTFETECGECERMFECRRCVSISYVSREIPEEPRHG